MTDNKPLYFYKKCIYRVYRHLLLAMKTLILIFRRLTINQYVVSLYTIVLFLPF